MALRTIADLPSLDVEKVKRSEELMHNFSESLMEISYMEDYDNWTTYKSKNLKVGSLSSLIADGIVRSDTVICGDWSFDNGVTVNKFFNLSGNLVVNEDPDNDPPDKYYVLIRARDITLNSLNMNLSSENLTAYMNNGRIRNYAGNVDIAEWNQDVFKFYVPLSAQNIHCSNLTVDADATFNGTATFANVINGCALCARWADLAEMYRSDADYPPGTLVKFGGEAEITVADGRANAVVTDRPGLILNGAGGRDGLYKGVALVGRTPVLAKGPVKKFDRLAADPDSPGTAKTAGPGDAAVAVALDELPPGGTGLVECAVQLRL